MILCDSSSYPSICYVHLNHNGPDLSGWIQFFPEGDLDVYSGPALKNTDLPDTMHNVASYLMNSISRIWIDPIKIADATVTSLTQNPKLLILIIGRTCYKYNITQYQHEIEEYVTSQKYIAS